MVWVKSWSVKCMKVCGEESIVFASQSLAILRGTTYHHTWANICRIYHHKQKAFKYYSFLDVEFLKLQLQLQKSKNLNRKEAGHTNRRRTLRLQDKVDAADQGWRSQRKQDAYFARHKGSRTQWLRNTKETGYSGWKKQRMQVTKRI